MTLIFFVRWPFPENGAVLHIPITVKGPRHRFDYGEARGSALSIVCIMHHDDTDFPVVADRGGWGGGVLCCPLLRVAHAVKLLSYCRDALRGRCVVRRSSTPINHVIAGLCHVYMFIFYQ